MKKLISFIWNILKDLFIISIVLSIMLTKAIIISFIVLFLPCITLYLTGKIELYLLVSIIEIIVATIILDRKNGRFVKYFKKKWSGC